MESPEPKPNEPTADQSKPEGLLYHYTDQNGLDGILASDCIWATHYRFLNDVEERKIGFDLYLKVLEAVCNSKKDLTPDGITAWKKTLLNYSETCAAYTVSFSRDRGIDPPGQAGDRLSQWRGYGAATQGYCLGFHRRSIEKISAAMPGKLRLAGFLGDCSYSADAAAITIESHIRKHFDRIQAIRNENFRRHPLKPTYSPYNDPDAGSAISEFAGKILFQSSVIKHAGFEEENETRLIVIFVDGVSDCNLIDFRPGHLGQTPYIKIPHGIVGDSSLSRIVIGPSASQEQAFAALKIRLRQMGLRHVEVVPSQIPYRNW